MIHNPNLDPNLLLVLGIVITSIWNWNKWNKKLSLNFQSDKFTLTNTNILPVSNYPIVLCIRQQLINSHNVGNDKILIMNLVHLQHCTKVENRIVKCLSARLSIRLGKIHIRNSLNININVMNVYNSITYQKSWLFHWSFPSTTTNLHEWTRNGWQLENLQSPTTCT